jgi:hypothetical protein
VTVSYLEIYNEDLNDLQVDDTPTRSSIAPAGRADFMTGAEKAELRKKGASTGYDRTYMTL